MEWLAQLMGGGAGEAFKGIGALAKDIRAAITGKSVLDATAQAEIELKLAAMEQAATMAAMQYDTTQMQGQVEINKLEAQSGNWMASNWRPLTGMVCVAAMALVFIVKPLLPWMVQIGGIIVGNKNTYVPPIPDIPIDQLMILLTGMLGLGGMRTAEKIKGVAR